jgi:cytochrome c556
MKQRVRGVTRSAAALSAAGLGLAAVVMAALPLRAIGADADPSLTGISHPDDLIMARQLLMDSNETAMMVIDPAPPPPNQDLAAMKAQAYLVYTNLSVAPHLFPSSTKPTIAADGSSSSASAAAPALWDNFDAVYNQFTDAANLAYDMSQATDLAKFRMQATMLRADCDNCHMKNMHVFDPTKSP